MGGFSLQLGVFSFDCVQKKRTYLTASFHRFWLLPKAVQCTKRHNAAQTLFDPQLDILEIYDTCLVGFNLNLT